MNLVVLESSETGILPAGTPEAEHLLQVLKVAPGSTFWCGVKNGVRGLATVSGISASGDVSFSVEWERAPALALPPVRLAVGLSRPQTMKKIFAVASEIGCSRIDVFKSEKGDPAYAKSSLWQPGDETFSEILKKSAEQTCVPAIPQYRLFCSLEDFLEDLEENSRCDGNENRVALDVYASEKSLGDIAVSGGRETILAIGSERGWTDTERTLLKGNAFKFAHLGERVLRVETAVSVALSVVLSKIGFWTPHKPLN